MKRLTEFFKSIPWYGYLYAALTVGWQVLIYFITGQINSARASTITAVDVKIPVIDDAIPFIAKLSLSLPQLVKYISFDLAPRKSATPVEPTVASAAPMTPIFGKPKSPKINSELSTKLVTTAAIEAPIGVTVSPVSLIDDP